MSSGYFSDHAEVSRSDLPGSAHARPDRRALDHPYPARPADQRPAALSGPPGFARRRGAQHAVGAAQDARKTGTDRRQALQRASAPLRVPPHRSRPQSGPRSSRPARLGPAQYRERLAGADLVQHRPQIVDEGLRVLAHWKVAQALHDGHFRTRNAVRGSLRIARRGRVVVLAGEQVERAEPGIDGADAVAYVALDLVEVQVSSEDAGPTLHVVPHRLPAVFLWAERRHQAIGEAAAGAAAVHLGVIKPRGVVVALDVRRGLKADQRAQLARGLER